MTYRARHYLFFMMAAASLTAATLWWATSFMVTQLPTFRWLHDLLFRTPIQFATLGTFFFVLTILAHRVVHNLFSVRPALRRLAAGLAVRRSSTVARRYEEVRRCRDSEGAGPAAAHLEALAARDEREMGRLYDLVGGGTQLIFALAFFGNVWGMRQQMFGSSTTGEDLSAFTPKALLDGFVGALGTALDATVLGVACALVVSLAAAVICRLEGEASRNLRDLVARKLGLDSAARVPDTTLPELIETRLAALAESLLERTDSALTALVTRSCDILEARLAEATREHMVRVDEQSARVISTLAEAGTRMTSDMSRTLSEEAVSLRSALAADAARVAAAIEQWIAGVGDREQVAAARWSEAASHIPATIAQALELEGAQIRQTLISEATRLGEHLERTPEVLIRYPGSEVASRANGSAALTAAPR